MPPTTRKFIKSSLKRNNLLPLSLSSLYILFNVRLLDWFGMYGIVLYPFVLFSPPKDCLFKELIQHEFIHARQIQREGFLSFYFSYAKEFMMNVMKELIQAFSKQPPPVQRKKKSSLESSSSSNTNGVGGGIRSFSLGRVMRNISYEDEAYGLEGISLYDEEKRFMKEKFDIDMDELMTEEEYTSADVYSSGDE